jgi:hypothetical protein
MLSDNDVAFSTEETVRFALLANPNSCEKRRPYNPSMSQSEYEVIVPKDLEDLIPIFLANRQRELVSLTSALVISDFVRLRQIGRCMKGVGSAYGFAPITALGELVGHFVSASDLDSVAKCVAQYRDLLSKLRVKFK